MVHGQCTPVLNWLARFGCLGGRGIWRHASLAQTVTYVNLKLHPLNPESYFFVTFFSGLRFCRGCGANEKAVDPQEKTRNSSKNIVEKSALNLSYGLHLQGVYVYIYTLMCQPRLNFPTFVASWDSITAIIWHTPWQCHMRWRRKDQEETRRRQNNNKYNKRRKKKDEKKKNQKPP